MYKFLVVRKDACAPGRRIRTSEFFPMIVDFDDRCNEPPPAEHVVREALARIGDGSYIGFHDYLVVPLRDAEVVSFRKPQPQVEVHVRKF